MSFPGYLQTQLAIFVVQMGIAPRTHRRRLLEGGIGFIPSAFDDRRSKAASCYRLDLALCEFNESHER